MRTPTTTADGNLRTARLPGLWPGWDVEEAFQRLIKKVDGPCPWLWIGPRRDNGYGQIRLRVTSPRGPAWRLESAHRISHELFIGPIPPGLHVLHSCDNPPCVWPDHLRAGTDGENMADRVKRGRFGLKPIGLTAWKRAGHNHHNATLRDMDVVAIRERFSVGQSASSLAREFRISTQHAMRLIRGESRKRAGGPVTKLPIQRPFGHQVHGAKLTAERVIALRGAREDGATIYALAEQFGITPQTVSKICRRESWRHVK